MVLLCMDAWDRSTVYVSLKLSLTQERATVKKPRSFFKNHLVVT